MLDNRKSKVSTEVALVAAMLTGLFQFFIAAFCATYVLRSFDSTTFSSLPEFSKEHIFWIGLAMLILIGISMLQESEPRYLKALVVELVFIFVATYGGEVYTISFGRAFMLIVPALVAIALFFRGLISLGGYIRFMKKKKAAAAKAAAAAAKEASATASTQKSS